MIKAEGPTISQVLTQPWFPKFLPGSSLSKVTLPAWRITTLGSAAQLALSRQTDGKPYTTTWTKFFDEFIPFYVVVKIMQQRGYQLSEPLSSKTFLVFLLSKSES